MEFPVLIYTASAQVYIRGELFFSASVIGFPFSNL